MHREIYNELYDTLIKYQELHPDSPLGLDVILRVAEFQFENIDYSNENLQQRVSNLCGQMDLISGKNTSLTIQLQFSVVSLIDNQFAYFKRNVGGILNASMETLASDHADKKEYWLTSWDPDRLQDKKLFLEELDKAEDGWKLVSDKLRKALNDLIFMAPDSNLEYQYDVLKNHLYR